MALEVIVLAAGAGTRMRSSTAKVLHPLAGRPLLAHVLDAATCLEPHRIHVVIGEQGDDVKRCFADKPGLSWVFQTPRLGTGHAVAQALPHVAADATVLVLLGDVPLVRPELLAQCVAHACAGLALVTAELDDPSGFGRIQRCDGRVVGIVEDADASVDKQKIREVNTGILAAPAAVLAELLATVGADNQQGEYYLTDIVAMAAERGIGIVALKAPNVEEVFGINDQAQLAHLERYHQRQQAQALMAAGVTVMDPARLDIRGRVVAGRDCVIDVGVVFEGEVRLGDGVTVGAHCVIRDARLGDGVEVRPMTCIDGAVIAADCRIGPYARVRPGTELGEAVHIGNFVETKKARLGAGTKANHLAYLGDASVGAACNIGAGAVTCNYDGVDKHRTELGDSVFVGTNATLVAPLVVEAEAYVGAGSTVTRKVGREELAVGRCRQRNVQGWTPPAKRLQGKGK